MPESITVSRVLPARAERIFSAWLDVEEHAKMTGSGATAGPDGTFTAGDGYIHGKTLESTPYSRIVQRWRTTEFPEGAPDSTLTVTLEDLGEEGTKVTLTQEGMPEGDSQRYAEGWEKFYFAPMAQYFASTGSRLKEVGAAIEEAVEKTTQAVGHAIEEAREELGETAKQAQKAMTSARARAKSAVKAVKKAQRNAVAKAKAVGKRVGKLLGGKSKSKPGGKQAGAKKATAMRPAAKKTSAKAAPSKAAPKRPGPSKGAASKAGAARRPATRATPAASAKTRRAGRR